MLHTFRTNFFAIEDKLTVSFYRMKLVIDDMASKFEVQPITKVANYCVSGSYIPEYADTGCLYLRGQNVRNFELNLNQEDIVYIGGGVTIPDKIRVKKKDIVILRTTSSESNIGNASIIPTKYDGSIISQHVTKVGISKLDPYYALSFLNSRYGRFQLLRAGYGSTRLELTHSELGKVLIPTIAIEQRKKIATLLKKAEFKSIQALEEISQAKYLFTQALGIDLKNDKKVNSFKVGFRNLGNLWTPKFYYPLYQSTLRKIKRKFETTQLGVIAPDISKGNEIGSENYKGYLQKTDTDVPFVRTSDIINYEIDSYPDFYASADICDELNQDLKAGDILFTNDGKIGLCAMFTENDKCVLQSHIRRVRIKEKLSPYYVFTFLTTDFALYQVYRFIVVQATLPTISNNLAQIEIPILPEDKQEEVSNLIKHAFKLKGEKKALIKEANHMIEKIIE